MGIADSFSKEDRIQVKFSDFYNLVKGCTQRDMIANAVQCDIPHRYIREMLSGEKEVLGAVTEDVESGDTDLEGYQE